MATIDSRLVIAQLIAGNGRIDPEDAADNPWVVKIVEYTTYEGRQAWGVVFENEERIATLDGRSFADRYEQPTATPSRDWWRRSHADRSTRAPVRVVRTRRNATPRLR